MSKETLDLLAASGHMLVNDLRPLQDQEREAVRKARTEGRKGDFLVWWSNGEISILGVHLVTALHLDPTYRKGYIAVLAVETGATQ